jgi:hypothetical protein
MLRHDVVEAEKLENCCDGVDAMCILWISEMNAVEKEVLR